LVGFWAAGVFRPTTTTRPDTTIPTTEADLIAKVKQVAGIDLVAIPAGAFWMGSYGDDTAAFGDEKPRHKVRISKGFYLGKYKVTVGQFRRFSDATGYETTDEKDGELIMWKNPRFKQTEEHPVMYVSWDDANAFCQWLAKETGAKVRLPREAEWEYSCRAGTTTKYYFGDNEADLGDYAWYSGNRKGKGTQPCGRKKPNAFGLYDMHGNAWEWCADGKRTYKDQEETDPVGPTSARVIRGGAFYDDPRHCRAAYRGGSSYSGDHTIGFRVLVGR
jgi:formylglycine-generating enzyme required for sulfatase activity